MISPHRRAALMVCLAAVTLSALPQTKAQSATTVQLAEQGTYRPGVEQPRHITFADRDRVLGELHDTMSNLTSLMEKHAMMTQPQLRTIAHVVNKLSQNIQTLSMPLSSNNAASRLAKVSENNRQLNATIEELQDQLNDN